MTFRRKEMSIEENKAVIRRLFEEFYRKRNTAVLDEIVSPDYVRHFGEAGWRDQKERGPEAYRQELKNVGSAFPDFSFTYEQLIAEGDRVAVVSVFSGTHQGDWRGPDGGMIMATGRRVTLPIIVVSRISGGKIVED
jgi:predicted ester cyclase